MPPSSFHLQSLPARAVCTALLVAWTSTTIAMASAAPAPSAKPSGDQPKLKPVDPGVADVGPLSGPGRTLPTDLRQPSNFDRVYEVELDGKRFFVRAHGGVYAIFPRSDYVQTRSGVAPVVPAGTVFHLGSLPKNQPTAAETETIAPGAAKPARPMRQDQAAPVLAAPNAESAQPPPVPGNAANPTQRQDNQPPLSNAAPTVRRSDPTRDSIWQSELYRSTRTSELLDKARAARARSAADQQLGSEATPSALATPESGSRSSAP